MLSTRINKNNKIGHTNNTLLDPEETEQDGQEETFEQSDDDYSKIIDLDEEERVDPSHIALIGLKIKVSQKEAMEKLVQDNCFLTISEIARNAIFLQYPSPIMEIQEKSQWRHINDRSRGRTGFTKEKKVSFSFKCSLMLFEYMKQFQNRSYFIRNALDYFLTDFEQNNTYSKTVSRGEGVV